MYRLRAFEHCAHTQLLVSSSFLRLLCFLGSGNTVIYVCNVRLVMNSLLQQTSLLCQSHLMASPIDGVNPASVGYGHTENLVGLASTLLAETSGDSARSHRFEMLVCLTMSSRRGWQTLRKRGRHFVGWSRVIGS